MPYRRLPNTDRARIWSMEQALAYSLEADVSDMPISFKVQNNIRAFLGKFKKANMEYLVCYKRQSSASKRHIKLTKTARLYVSHFIQVFNLAVLREEIKASAKNLYGLEPSNYTVPDMSSEPQLLEWGKRIIEGEAQRKQEGGAPIYNPTIAKVQVHYDMFAESYHSQRGFQQATARSLALITEMRAEADRYLLEAWNEIEAHYAHLPTPTRLDSCQRSGVIYYYRREEKERIKAAKLMRKIPFDD